MKKKLISILFIFSLFVLVGCTMPYSNHIPGGIYGNQYGYAGYGYDTYSQPRTVSIKKVGRNSKAFVVEAEKFHQNITGMSMCATGGTKTDSTATATGTVTDNSGRINYQISTASQVTESCNNLQIKLQEMRK